MDKRGEEGGKEYHDFPLKICCLTVPKLFPRGTLLCFRKFLVSKNVSDKKRGCHNFLSNLFCLTVPKKFLEEPFSVSENFEYRKTLCIEGGYQDFLSEIFCLTVPKNFVGEPFLTSEKFWYRIFHT